MNVRRENGLENGLKYLKTILKRYLNCQNDTKTVSKRQKTLLKRCQNGPNDQETETVSLRCQNGKGF